jgi:hypothetical protein
MIFRTQNTHVGLHIDLCHYLWRLDDLCFCL